MGASVFRILVTDLDEGTNAEIQYSLSGNGADRFTIDPSGEVQVSSLGVDYEAVFDTPYVLIVTAMDQGEDIPQQMIKFSPKTAVKYL